MIEAKIICDSISPNGVRLTSFQLKYPRFILAEVNTHRVFSRCSASSRAIPVKRMILDVLEDPVIPEFFGKNQSGMQAKVELDGFYLKLAKFMWRFARYPSCIMAYLLSKIGLHKQITNRLIEPWMWARTIITSTEWENFFELRIHPDAQPEIFVLASKMLEEYKKSNPKELKYGEWHLPYISKDELNNIPISDLIKMSAARCARVSYLNHDGKTPDMEKDLRLYEDLVGSRPIHASPIEHQATPIHSLQFEKNFVGWHQHRSDVEKFDKDKDENIFAEYRNMIRLG